MEYKLHSAILIFVSVLFVCIGSGAIQGAICNFGHWAGNLCYWLLVLGMVASIFILLVFQSIHCLCDGGNVFRSETPQAAKDECVVCLLRFCGITCYGCVLCDDRQVEFYPLSARTCCCGFLLHASFVGAMAQTHPALA